MSGGHRLNLNKELKFFRKFQKICGGGSGRGVRLGVRIDVNEEVK